MFSCSVLQAVIISYGKVTWSKQWMIVRDKFTYSVGNKDYKRRANIDIANQSMQYL